jgi:DNA-binding transcriptional MerR regulator
MMLTIKEAAAELRVSKQWLQYWLVEHPVDAAGVPFYVPMGNRKRFEPQDIDRIRSYMRDLEAARLGPSMKGIARLVGLMSAAWRRRIRRASQNARGGEAEEGGREAETAASAAGQAAKGQTEGLSCNAHVSAHPLPASHRVGSV